MIKITKKDFIEAYRYLYGATIKEAQKAYSGSGDEYKKAIIESLKADAKKAFYND